MVSGFLSMRVLELFCGIGGWRYALGDLGTVVAAYDISPAAMATYALNHQDRPIARELATITEEMLIQHGADTWMMSPPCQPFCRMGNRQGLKDLRSRAFLRLMEIFERAAPEHLVLENVIGFEGSDAHELLLSRLRSQGMHWLECELCPTLLGIPNLRPRYFLVASRRPIPARLLPSMETVPLAGCLDTEEDSSCYLDEQTLTRYRRGMDFVTAQDRRSTCFIGGYGQRFVGSGSFLSTKRGVRRFSPAEIARLMGLPESFRFPDSVSLEQRYKLLGNGLNIPVARWVLETLAL